MSAHSHTLRPDGHPNREAHSLHSIGGCATSNSPHDCHQTTAQSVPFLLQAHVQIFRTSVETSTHRGKAARNKYTPSTHVWPCHVPSGTHAHTQSQHRTKEAALVASPSPPLCLTRLQWTSWGGGTCPPSPACHKMHTNDTAHNHPLKQTPHPVHTLRLLKISYMS